MELSGYEILTEHNFPSLLQIGYTCTLWFVMDINKMDTTSIYLFLVKSWFPRWNHVHHTV